MNDGKKYRTVSVRLTEEDFMTLSRNAERAGLKSISEYIRLLVLDEDTVVDGARPENEKQLLEKLNFNMERMLLLMEIGQQTSLETFGVLYRRTTDNSDLPKEEKMELLKRSQKAIEAIKTSAVDKVKEWRESDDGEDPFMEELYLNWDEDQDETYSAD